MAKAALEEMHTGSLLSRMDQLPKCEESFRRSDRHEYEDEPDPADSGFIEFKDTDAWRAAYADLKEILSLREHLPNAKERKETRRKRSQR